MSKQFDIGSLKHKVVFKKNTRGSLGGGSGANFETFLTTRCSLEKKRSAKQNNQGKVDIAVFYLMRCRFDGNFISQLNGSCIAVITNQFGQEITYVIHDFDLVDEKKHLYEFTLSKSNV